MHRCRIAQDEQRAALRVARVEGSEEAVEEALEEAA
jgi:hypothetical protein